jgi:hypothetical protein
VLQSTALSPEPATKSTTPGEATQVASAFEIGTGIAAAAAIAVVFLTGRVDITTEPITPRTAKTAPKPIPVPKVAKPAAPQPTPPPAGNEGATTPPISVPPPTSSALPPPGVPPGAATAAPITSQ